VNSRGFEETLGSADCLGEFCRTFCSAEGAPFAGICGLGEKSTIEEKI
jgi:hypothetical protein